MEGFEPSAHEKWVESQGLPVYRGFHVNLPEVKTAPWKRLGAYGAYVLFDGTEEFFDSYVLDIPEGGSVKPERHIYEEVFYVLSGRGSASVWLPGGSKVSFGWREGSLFSIPLNAWHEFHNGGGGVARLFAVTSAPVTLNLFRNPDFVFNNDFAFTDRFRGEEDYFSRKPVERPGRVLETNLVEDARALALLEWRERGAGGLNRFIQMAEGCMTAHLSEFPAGSYKKAHRHGPAYIVVVSGEGYSLFWPPGGESRRVRVDWRPGTVVTTPVDWYHQHFNVGREPARYLAIHWFSRKYPPFRKSVLADMGRDLNTRQGGRQIEYEDEDPLIHQLFHVELQRRGIECRMDMFHKAKS